MNELLSPKQMDNINELVLRIAIRANVNNDISEDELEAVKEFCITALAANYCYQDLLEKLKKMRDEHARQMG